MNQKMFEGFPKSTSDFYCKIIWMMALNLQACQYGLFDVVLCDTDDEISWFRFIEQMPNIKVALDMDGYNTDDAPILR